MMIGYFSLMIVIIYSLVIHTAILTFIIMMIIILVEGCDIFENTNNCNCIDYNGTMNFYEYYDDDWDDDYWNDDQSGDGDFNYQMCENGCIYNIEKNVYLLYST